MNNVCGIILQLLPSFNNNHDFVKIFSTYIIHHIRIQRFETQEAERVAQALNSHNAYDQQWEKIYDAKMKMAMEMMMYLVH